MREHNDCMPTDRERQDWRARTQFSMYCQDLGMDINDWPVEDITLPGGGILDIVQVPEELAAEYNEWYCSNKRNR